MNIRYPIYEGVYRILTVNKRSGVIGKFKNSIFGKLSHHFSVS